IRQMNAQYHRQDTSRGGPQRIEELLNPAAFNLSTRSRTSRSAGPTCTCGSPLIHALTASLYSADMLSP
ncbi:MAG: hypothetical protein P8L85_11290, partial [Rubripirellula sp.]|nr:hypothetical protein [Rubripirellula sp.]